MLVLIGGLARPAFAQQPAWSKPAGGTTATAPQFATPAQPISQNIEKVVYFQKPAQESSPSQAVVPPAPPALSRPVAIPFETSSTPVTTRNAVFQPPMGTTPPNELKPPTRDEVFRFDSDEQLQARIRRQLLEEYRIQDLRILSAPTGGPVSTNLPARTIPAMQVLIEPSYVVHRRLMFEEMNTERAGWDIGLLQPLISTGYFYKDVLFWPHKVCSNILEPYDTSAGKCLPGSPTPYLIYPPEITAFGAVTGTTFILLPAFIIP